eukprot:TRINITY_DN3010_c1_g5_i1.p1 TRINITY_DN3010_c1_g5~~TRINITY_DN3010_c1_g5_i1.p1  ORF type:complete len:791 (-),score=212.66 TRINITY_DN3010_c1_g5_i1:186-2558(-)
MSKSDRKSSRSNNTAPKFNPFDSKKQKYKFGSADKSDDVIVKNTQARSKSFQKRENTIGLEYDRRNKKNKYIDRRFKYLLQDQNLSEQEKNLVLFQKERQKQWEQNDLYSVGNEILLTHGGRAIFDDEEDFGFDATSDFGGMERVDGDDFFESKSKADVMKSIISKSKFYRHQKTVEREKRLEMTEKLDDELEGITSMLFEDENQPMEEEHEGNENSEDSMSVEEVDGDIAAEILALDKKQKPEQEKVTEADPFDELLQQMQKDRKAKPTNPLLTESDIAKAEMQRLQQLEEERIKRMKGEDSDEGYEGGDDLIDDYSRFIAPEKETRKRSRKERALSSNTIIPTPIAAGSEEISSLNADDDIPFVIVMPTSFESFNNLVEGQSAERVKLIIERIRASNHVSLLPENKDKMKKFVEYLFLRFEYVADKENIDREQLDILVKPIFQLSNQMVKHSSDIAKERLKQIYLKLRDNTWISNGDILFFMLVSRIWPVTDRRHPVITPSYLLMSKSLSALKVTNLSEMVKGILLANIFLQCTSSAERYTPEIFTFLSSVLLSFSGSTDPLLVNLISGSEINPEIVAVDSWGKKYSKKIRLLALNDLSNQEESNKRLVLSILNSTLSLYAEYFSNVKNESSGYIYPASIGLSILDSLSDSKFPELIVKKIEEVRAQLSSTHTALSNNLAPLQFRKKRAVQLPLLTPDFQDDYSSRTAREPNKDQRELRRLQKQLKAEYKSAERELRKDTKYLAQKKAEEAKIMRKEDQDKTNKIFQFLEEQQHQKKTYNKMKPKMKL